MTPRIRRRESLFDFILTCILVGILLGSLYVALHKHLLPTLLD